MKGFAASLTLLALPFGAAAQPSPTRSDIDTFLEEARSSGPMVLKIWPNFFERREAVMTRGSAVNWADKLIAPQLGAHGGVDDDEKPLHEVRPAENLQPMGRAYGSVANATDDHVISIDFTQADRMLALLRAHATGTATAQSVDTVLNERGSELIIRQQNSSRLVTRTQYGGEVKTDPPFPFASEQSIPMPILFGEGIISTGDYESHPAFTPDGRTLYFVKSTPTFSFWTIVVSHFVNGQWTTPDVAPFSGRYADADPFITTDGKQLYFISNRPAPGKTKRDLDIWVMDKTDSGWSEPRNLGAPINSDAPEWYPTVAADGTLYFGSRRPGGKGGNDLYRSRLVNGAYTEPENLGDAINTEFDEYEPYIAPDQSYLIFMAAGRPDGQGGGDLYISHQKDGAWTRAMNLRNLGNEINSPADEYSPTISPDGKYFFFASARERRPPGERMNYTELLARLRGPGNGLGDIYYVDSDRVMHVLVEFARISPVG